MYRKVQMNAIQAGRSLFFTRRGRNLHVTTPKTRLKTQAALQARSHLKCVGYEYKNKKRKQRNFKFGHINNRVGHVLLTLFRA